MRQQRKHTGFVQMYNLNNQNMGYVTLIVQYTSNLLGTEFDTEETNDKSFIKYCKDVRRPTYVFLHLRCQHLSFI